MSIVLKDLSSYFAIEYFIWSTILGHLPLPGMIIRIDEV